MQTAHSTSALPSVRAERSCADARDRAARRDVPCRRARAGRGCGRRGRRRPAAGRAHRLYGPRRVRRPARRAPLAGLGDDPQERADAAAAMKAGPPNITKRETPAEEKLEHVKMSLGIMSPGLIRKKGTPPTIGGHLNVQ